MSTAKELSFGLQGIGIVLGVGLIIGGLICLGGYCTRCKKCDKWYSQRTTRKEQIKEEPAAKDV
jgi:hypothetical protein